MRFLSCSLAVLGLLAQAGCQTTIPSAPMQGMPMTPAAPASPTPAAGSHSRLPASQQGQRAPGQWAYQPPPAAVQPPAANHQPARRPNGEVNLASSPRPVRAIPSGHRTPQVKLQKVQLAGPLVPVQAGRSAPGASPAQDKATVQPLPPVGPEQQERPNIPWPQKPIANYPQTPY